MTRSDHHYQPSASTRLNISHKKRTHLVYIKTPNSFLIHFLSSPMRHSLCLSSSSSSSVPRLYLFLRCRYRLSQQTNKQTTLHHVSFTPVFFLFFHFYLSPSLFTKPRTQKIATSLCATSTRTFSSFNLLSISSHISSFFFFLGSFFFCWPKP